MTPQETNLMRELVADAVATAVATAVSPMKAENALLRAEIAQLKAVDKRHSGTHSALGADIRKSTHEINAQVDDKVDAIARRDAQLIAALNEVRDTVQKSTEAHQTSIAPAAAAAEGAKTQATLAANEARDANDALVGVKKDAARAVKWWRHPAFVVVLFALLDWLQGHAMALLRAAFQ